MRRAVVVLSLALVMTGSSAATWAAASSASATTQHKTLDDQAPADGWSVAAVPTLVYNSDEGFGTGGVATVYHRQGGLAPYKDAITLKLYISTKLIQAHELGWDGLQLAGLPLRIFARLGYYSTVTQNFCGYGNSVSCDPAVAAEHARANGLSEDSDAFADFVRHYYLMRFIRAYGDLLLRYQLRDKPQRLEILLGWRGSQYWPGEIGLTGPYPGSLYAQEFAHGEAGFSSVPFVGLVLDNRDAETFPSTGYVLETSLRGAAPWTGSSWTYAGANLSFASFHRVLGSPRTVFAARVLGDVMVGDPSTEDLARIGGTNDALSFGGQALGRGIREHRYLGKLKAIHQGELRSQLWDFVLLQQNFTLGYALFYDVAGIIYDLTDPRGDPGQLRWGAGASLRVIWNRDFIIRFDVAGSPSEPGVPGVYIMVGNVF